MQGGTLTDSASHINICSAGLFEVRPAEVLELLEELAGVQVSIVAVGPSREQTIMRNW